VTSEAPTRRAPAAATPDGHGPHPGFAAHEWYTSPALLDHERRRLFDRTWALVGTDDQLPGPGSYLTAIVGSSPLLVVRGRDGEVRAFHNGCRHRGLPLAEGSGVCGEFLTCRYHQWSYDLNGTLRRIPQADTQFPDIDHQAWGLQPALAETWHGLVFANPDCQAGSLRSSLGFLADRLDGFLSGPLVEVARVEYTARCNWKLLVENHIDVYHLWYVHNRSLSMYDHRRFEWDQEAGNWWSLEPHKDPGSAQHSLGWLSRSELEGIGAHLFFPNVMIVTTGSYFATYDATPLTPDTTRLTLRIRSTAAADGAALIESVRSFLAEDLAICELLQQGVVSSHFCPGPFALSHEAPIAAFHHALASWCYA
jgi:phenylpropionate dioxygenase-like ring-hydroxylating dioxygenase large terminal subunit